MKKNKKKITIREWLNKHNMKVEINLKILKLKWDPTDADKDAAWNLYIELLTRVSTQYLSPDQGDEQIALESIHKLFDLTRKVIKQKGRNCIQFTRIAVIILNQKVRPFTAKWHKLSIQKAFDNSKSCEAFRNELTELQDSLRIYSKMLADMAGVEDLTDLEKS